MEAMFTYMEKDLEDQQLTPLHLKDLMINVHLTFDRWTKLLRQLQWPSSVEYCRHQYYVT